MQHLTRPAYLDQLATQHFKAGVIRCVTFDAPYTIGNLVLFLAKKLNAIEDYFICNSFSLRPLFANDIDDGVRHMKVFHAHFIIQPRGYLDEFERNKRLNKADGLPDNER